ncbi:MAG TPA: 7-cyano-7-deazaguanine synthase QueC [Fibrobacteria bacterium]|nr:7-cyano-7-deazaguanine synthase QueC [Fibrobacteria bacterium]
MKDRVCLAVFSGGQDSTTCLHWALETFKSVEAVFFDYGQRHAAEMQAAEAIAARLSIPLKVFRLDFFRELGGNALLDPAMAIRPVPEDGGLPNTFVPGRNLIFLNLAASYAFTRGIRDLVTGVCQTDYSGYPDCREETIKSLERALGQGLGWAGSGTPSAREDAFAIHTPLMFKTKAESVHWAVELGAMGSLALSHTCYEGAFPPCGACPACLLRERGFREAGVEDPLQARARQQR